MIISLLGIMVLSAGGLGLIQLDITYHLYYALIERLPFSWPGAPTLHLKKYSVLRDKIEIKGIQRNLSGITYNWDTDSLFAVIDEPPEILELSCQGVVLRRIRTRGLEDLEGICYLGQNRFAVVEERRRNVVFFKVHSTAVIVEGADLKMFPMPGEYDNHGFEGIAGDIDSGALYITNEHSPRRIIKISGIDFETINFKDVRVADLWETEPSNLGLRDFAGLHLDAATGHLLVLSDESQLLAEITTRGIRVGTLDLERGDTGLSADIPKPEGVTMDRKGTIFIASEPNLLYTFEIRP